MGERVSERGGSSPRNDGASLIEEAAVRFGAGVFDNAKNGLTVRAPTDAATDLLGVIENLGPETNGGFFDQTGAVIPW